MESVSRRVCRRDRAFSSVFTQPRCLADAEYPPTHSFQIARRDFAAANTRAVEILARYTLPRNTQSIARKIRTASTLYFPTGKPVDHRAFNSLGTEPIYTSI